VAVTQDGVSPTIFLNGEPITLVTTETSTDLTSWFNDVLNIDNCTIGCINISNNGPLTFMDGQISNVKIYNKALTAEEITQNYNTLKGRFGL